MKAARTVLPKSSREPGGRTNDTPRASSSRMVSSQASAGTCMAMCGKPVRGPISSTTPRCTWAWPSWSHAPSVPGPKSGRGSIEKPRTSR